MLCRGREGPQKSGHWPTLLRFPPILFQVRANVSWKKLGQPMRGRQIPSSQQLYQLVAIARDRTHTVLMTGLELAEANELREAIGKDHAVVWFQVERMPEE